MKLPDRTKNEVTRYPNMFALSSEYFKDLPRLTCTGGLPMCTRSGCFHAEAVRTRPAVCPAVSEPYTVVPKLLRNINKASIEAIMVLPVESWTSSSVLCS